MHPHQNQVVNSLIIPSLLRHQNRRENSKSKEGVEGQKVMGRPNFHVQFAVIWHLITCIMGVWLASRAGTLLDNAPN